MTQNFIEAKFFPVKRIVSFFSTHNKYQYMPIRFSLISSCILFFTFSFFLAAQQTSVSPYSAFGFGDKKFYVDPSTAAMAGTYTAYTSPFANEFNFANPAASANLDLTTFELIANTDISRFKESNATSASSNTYVSRISVGFPLGKKTKLGIGFQPFSGVGYDVISRTDNVTPGQTNNFYGNGSVNNLDMGLSFSVNKNLSIGTSLGYVFGNVKRNQEIEVDNSQLITLYEDNTDISGAKFTLGAFYNTKLKKDYYLSAGVSYNLGTRLSTQNNSVVTTFNRLANSDEFFEIDTLENLNTKSHIKYPQLFSLGLELGKEQSWRVSAQFDWENTKDFKFSNNQNVVPNIPIDNNYRIALGGFWIPNNNSYTSYFERITYRGGLYFHNTQVQIDNKKVLAYGLTLGAGLPIGKSNRNPSLINFAINLGQRNPQSDNFVKESFANFSIGVLFSDKWFQRRQIE